jgi:hypothetical protein
VQKTAMAMQMVPIGQLFQRTNRQVRDLSRKAAKQVELVNRGEDTELDKTIAEELSDPLMHMVRNAIDHGIEAPDIREAVGKYPQATITLAAYHQAGQIVIEVAGDGRGLDAEKILAKARQKSLIEDGAHLSESDVLRLILEPGFSTADQVTGRPRSRAGMSGPSRLSGKRSSVRCSRPTVSSEDRTARQPGSGSNERLCIRRCRDSTFPGSISIADGSRLFPSRLLRHASDR